MHRVITVLTMGPIYFSVTARLFSVVAALAPAISDRLVLQIALAALIADRAIERMIDEQELHDASRAFFTISLLVKIS